jgi:hypothetical protein
MAHSYFFYFSKMVGAAAFTVWGILCLAAIGICIYGLFSSRRGISRIAGALAIVLFTVSIYATEYEIPENADAQRQIMNQDGWESCGTGWTKPFSSGRGMPNACGYGCFRGATIRKIMTMHEFPPWPRFNREFECWRRTGDWEVKNPNPDSAAVSITP